MVRLKEELELRGLKFTRQRKIIAQKIFSMRKHFTAEELYTMLRKKHHVSRATIYRTLDVLASMGFVEVHDFGQGRRYYESITGKESHCHFICTGCMKIIEFPSDEVEAIINRMAKEHGFTVTRYSINVYGLCEDCARKLQESGKNIES